MHLALKLACGRRPGRSASVAATADQDLRAPLGPGAALKRQEGGSAWGDQLAPDGDKSPPKGWTVVQQSPTLVVWRDDITAGEKPPIDDERHPRARTAAAWIVAALLLMILLALPRAPEPSPRLTQKPQPLSGHAPGAHRETPLQASAQATVRRSG